MQAYTELTPSTAITHSVNLPFTSANASNLIVAKTSLLQIFAIKTVTTELDTNTEDATAEEEAAAAALNTNEEDTSFIVADPVQRSSLANTTKLVLVAEYNLAGTITSLARIRTPDSASGGESLLISFRDAKLSLIEWDPERHGISTTSIHYYEQDDVGGSPWEVDIHETVNYLVADPNSKCAALKFGSSSLAILPFKQGDEDEAMDDWDEELDGPRPESMAKSIANGTAAHENTPYSPSFVLRLSSLDPALIHPIHLAFLWEYREPTFGVLSSMVMPSTSLLEERKDQLSYMVFTLDLEQKESTTILVVTGLPYDLHKVVPLPAPVGGSLLIGCNELIHIDQSGKANGVAVNPFAKTSTSFGLADQADLELRLEGCTVQELSADNGELLIILTTGELAILSFKMDGRTVSGLRVRKVAPESGGTLIGARVSTTSAISRSTIFVGSEEADSVVLGWSRKSQGKGKKVENALDEDDDMDLDDVDDDDLYGDAPAIIPLKGAEASDSANSKAGDYVFRVHDSMLSIAPLRDITLSKAEAANESSDVVGDLELVGVSGRNKSGALAILKREVEPKVIGRFEFPEAYGVWTMSAKRPIPKAVQGDKSKVMLNGDLDMATQFDRLMIVSKAEEDSTEESSVYALTAAGFEALADTEFEPAAGATIECGTVGDGMRVIQVLKNEIRSYDGDLGLSQILAEDETGAELKVVSASIVDPYVLLIRDDASIYLAACDKHNDLEEMTREDDALLANKWLSGCLYKDTTDIFSNGEKDSVIMSLLNTDGALFMYALPDLSKPIYTANGVSTLPTTISPDYVAKRGVIGEMLTEILIANLGDATSQTPHLILRAASDDLTIFQPFVAPSTEQKPLAQSLHFLKIHNPHFAKSPKAAADETEQDEEAAKRDSPMRAISNLNGLACVFMPGPSAAFIFKSAQTIPRVLSLRGAGVRSLSSFHTEGCDRGFIYMDTTGIARVCELDKSTNVTDLGLTVRRVPLREDISHVAYHAPKNVYAVATQTLEPFELPRDDDYHKEWAKEDLTFAPMAPRGCVKLLSPQGWEVVDQHSLDEHETALCMQVLNLEISENSHKRRQVLCIGTGVSQGEDLPIKGRVWVFDIIRVVPFPGKPHTNTALRLLAKEEIPRGAVTSLSAIGSQGFLVVGQGQKAMVRGLKEDGTLLPVAFMDMGTYVTDIKTVPGSGLAAFADAVKGCWLVGYAEEPYKMIALGRQGGGMEIVALEMLPVGGDLYIVVADVDCNLHILQFDPEHPKSLHGQLLLHRTTFSLGGHLPSTMTLLPATPTIHIPPTTEKPEDEPIPVNPPQTVLLTTQTGSLALLTPLSEDSYRKLSTLSNHLSNALYHGAGTNPKAYRIAENAPEAIVGGRTILDGAILMRWTELGMGKRRDILGRLGEAREGPLAGGMGLREELRSLVGDIGYI